MERSATFNTTSFAEGRFRRAYKGRWTAPVRDAGRVCVVKEMKENYSWKEADWNDTVKINERAKDLAARFTSRTPAGYKIAYTRGVRNASDERTLSSHQTQAARVRDVRGLHTGAVQEVVQQLRLHQR